MQRPGADKSRDKCNQLADEMEKVMSGTEEKKGARQRRRELREDSRHLYEAEQEAKHANTFSNRDVKTWSGHQYIYQKLLDILASLFDQWNRGNCNRHGLKRFVVKEVEGYLKEGIPEKPDRLLANTELPVLPILIPSFVLQRVGKRLTTSQLWRRFWQVVIKKFAIRGTAATILSAADGPLPVGEIIGLGLAIWTIVDISMMWDELWSETIEEL